MATIWGTSGKDTRYGTSDNDTIYGLAGDDTLYGLGGNDVIDGGIGGDMMIGGTGNDTYVVDDYWDVVIEGRYDGAQDHVQASINYELDTYVENLTLTGSADLIGTGNGGKNTIIGNSGDNDLWGLGGNDILKGGGGNDALIGGTGIDTMAGGTGDDSYNVDATGDVLIEYAGEGYDKVVATASFTLPDHVEDLWLWETGGAINGAGNAQDNKLKGNSSANILNGAGGNDHLTGGGGLDTLYGGAGDDEYLLEDADIVIEEAGGGIDEVTAYIDYTLTANVENLVLVVGTFGGGNDLDNVIVGNDSVNTLTGGAGNDLLGGGGGADTLIGGTGDDSYSVENIGDTVVELDGEGEDTVYTLVSYTLGTAVENLHLGDAPGVTHGTGNNLDNDIIGNDIGNVLMGLAGNDHIDGQQGQDFMYGGLGDDSYVVHSADDQVIEAFGEGWDSVFAWSSYTLGANVETLTLWAGANGTGNDLDNNIGGNDGNNILTGGGGSDHLMGRLGADTLIGGTGDDYFYVDQAGDSIVELADEGYDTVYAKASYVLSANVERIWLEDGAALNATGNASDNQIYGNANDNMLVGGDGNDTLDGKTGADTMIGGIGDDAYFVDNEADAVVEAANGGFDTVSTSLSTYVLAGALENLGFWDEAGDANGTGNDLANIISGNASANVLAGGGNNDTLHGKGGNDLLEGGAGADHIHGGDGIDTLVYATSDAAVLINLGNGLAAGGHALGDYYTGIENVTGSAHADGLFGDGLVNVLTGAGGNDYLWGGLNADTFVFAAGFGKDTIGDWQSDDTIQFSSAVFASFAAVQAAMQQVGADTVITLDAANTITLQNVSAAGLTSADFLFA